MVHRKFTSVLALLLVMAACEALRTLSRGVAPDGSHSLQTANAMTSNHDTGLHREPEAGGGNPAQWGTLSTPPLVVGKAAKTVRFDFGDDGTTEQRLLASGRYDPTSVVPYDVTADSQSRGRLFVATPPTKLGVPVTLSTVPSDGVLDAPLEPYPSLELHRTTEDSIADCNTQFVSIISTVKTWSDDDTLFALDSGVLEITTNPTHVCPPKIITFDLRTDKIANVTVIENSYCDSQYLFFWVDECSAGRRVAYSGDAIGAILTVTDLTTGASKHLTSPYFQPYPELFYVAAGGPSFYMTDGLYGLSADSSCDGKLYLQAFCSNVQGVVDKAVIRVANDGDVLDSITQVALPGRLAGSSGPLAVDPEGERLFFPIQEQMAVYCWNTSKPHHPSYFRLIAQDSKLLRFVSSVKIDPASHQLCIQTNRFTSYFWNTLDYSEENYHVLYINISGIQC